MVRLVPAIVHCLLAIVNHSKAGGGSGLLIGLANVSLIQGDEVRVSIGRV